MSVSRVCIQADRDGDPVAVDVALPSGAPVGALLPALVELVDDRVFPGGEVRRWRLNRLPGGILEESLSLTDNGVRDGELLILTPDDAPALGPLRRSAYHEASASDDSGCYVDRFLPGTICVLAAALAAVALSWTAGSETATVNAIIAAVGAACAAGMTIATGYPTAPSLAVVCLSCATGFLAVPAGPATPNVFLAATAAASASLLMMRLSGRASPALTATAASSVLVAIMTLVPIPVAAIGAALSTAALALLALAPRLSVVAAGLGPDRWHGDLTKRAHTGHAILSGLLAGGTASAVAGVLVVAGAENAGVPATARIVTFTALIGGVLLLRARIHVDAARRIALLAGGLASIAACLHVAVDSHHDSAGPVACALVVVGLCAVRRPSCGPALSRTIDRLEYVALAAVIPAACWVAGVYAVVGGFSLR
ncbi:type VII secretion integral membrane protein EccD [Mycolicibacterium hodleri]|uniref:Type VII secretion integral membrane protein EccD n=1 Tax=Mycolicibacterium hodleri TaxID=49897 RepID=A0A502ED28_9MYCO|nr:type VII secretion integral membrane protein EccD [Mycolicibacterium hodleri]TPG34396.1 type VII secretion integral membrane protein EccD [Mycolicibacterium hodleri]